MGREAVCACEWGGTVAEVKALLEANEIILRGAVRKRIPFSEITSVNAKADRLCFTVGGEEVQLALGHAAAQWVAAITSPPPTLARKLGIADKIVRVIGEVCDEALNEALAGAAKIASKDAEVILACVDSANSVHAALRDAKAQLRNGVPIWMVYAKGPGHAINETSVRESMRETGMVDTKVASVSAKYTALRFILRNSG